jgi:cystathionine beta-lyase
VGVCPWPVPSGGSSPPAAAPPQESYLAWLNCRALGLGDDPAGAFLDRGRVALAPGVNYGRSGAGYARLNFGTSAEMVGDMVRRMADAVHRRPAQ